MSVIIPDWAKPLAASKNRLAAFVAVEDGFERHCPRFALLYETQDGRQRKVQMNEPVSQDQKNQMGRAAAADGAFVADVREVLGWVGA